MYVAENNESAVHLESEITESAALESAILEMIAGGAGVVNTI